MITYYVQRNNELSYMETNRNKIDIRIIAGLFILAWVIYKLVEKGILR